jgi:hypothetical protein
MVNEGVKVPVAVDEKRYPLNGPTTILLLVKFIPLKLKDMGADTLFTQTKPNPGNAVADSEAGGGAAVVKLICMP